MDSGGAGDPGAVGSDGEDAHLGTDPGDPDLRISPGGRDAAVLRRRRDSGGRSSSIPISDVGRSGLREGGPGIHLGLPGERLRRNLFPAAVGGQAVQRPGQNQRLRLLLPSVGDQAGSDRAAGRVDLRRHRVEFPAPPPADDGDAGGVRDGREPGRERNPVDRGDRASPRAAAVHGLHPASRQVVHRGPRQPVQYFAAGALLPVLRQPRGAHGQHLPGDLPSQCGVDDRALEAELRHLAR